MTRSNTFDLFAEALWQFYETGKAELWNERDDGYRRREPIDWYFTPYPEFLPIEKRALKFAHGHVLDAGCGAGRHSLYLQKRGLAVTAIDISARAIDLAQARGVRDARVIDLTRRLPFRTGQFDTVILFGNNLGIAGSAPKFFAMLRELHRVTSRHGRILATTRQPSTTNPVHRSYLRRNVARGNPIGQIRIRQWLNGRHSAWFNLLLFAPTDLMRLAAQAHWEIAQIYPAENFEAGYAVVLEKS
jgi:SAM-dependent methyltransferase